MSKGKLLMDGNVVIGYTSRPLERLVYDPELDFETKNLKEKNKRDYLSKLNFSNPSEVIKMYESGASLNEIALKEGMGQETVRNKLIKLGVNMRSRGRKSSSY